MLGEASSDGFDRAKWVREGERSEQGCFGSLSILVREWTAMKLPGGASRANGSVHTLGGDSALSVASSTGEGVVGGHVVAVAVAVAVGGNGSMVSLSSISVSTVSLPWKRDCVARLALLFGLALVGFRSGGSASISALVAPWPRSLRR